MPTEAVDKMRIIGVTGGVGAGKSSVMAVLETEYGAFVIRADDVAKRLQEPGQPGYIRLQEVFGHRILGSDGQMNRAVLADIIFHDPAALAQVNDIIHPLTWEQIRQMIRTSKAELIAMESALFNEQSSQICDEIWFVDTPDEVRIRRLAASRGYTPERSRQIMANQRSRADFLAFADRVIDNSGTVDDVRRQIKKIFQAEGRQS